MRGGEEEGSGGEGFSRQVAAGKVFLSLERTTTSDLSFLPGRWPSLRCFKPSCHLCCRALLLRRCRRRRRPASGVRRPTSDVYWMFSWSTWLISFFHQPSLWMKGRNELRTNTIFLFFFMKFGQLIRWEEPSFTNFECVNLTRSFELHFHWHEANDAHSVWNWRWNKRQRKWLNNNSLIVYVDILDSFVHFSFLSVSFFPFELHKSKRFWRGATEVEEEGREKRGGGSCWIFALDCHH